MKKRFITMLIIFGIFLFGYILFDSWRTTTFEEVMADVLNESVVEMNLLITNSNYGDTKNVEERIITEQEEITKILNDPGNMEIKRVLNSAATYFLIELKTENNKNYSIIFGDDGFVSPDGKYYQITGDNKLYEAFGIGEN